MSAGAGNGAGRGGEPVGAGGPGGRWRAEATYRWDLVRYGFQGVTETVFHGFVLLVAIRVFDADEKVMKPTLAGGVALGLLLSPLTVAFVARRCLPAARACAFFSLLSGLLLAAAAVASNLWVFFFAAWFAQVALAQQPPLITHLYALNYGPGERGRRVSSAVLVGGLAAVATSLLGGWLLDLGMDCFPLLFLAGAAASWVSAAAFARMPTGDLGARAGAGPWRHLGLVWKDRTFGLMLAAWMLLGIGNLMTIPIRVEYLASPEHGLGATPLQFAVIMVFIPDVTRLVFTKVWGSFFDRLNFIVLRVALNALFFVSIFLFFSTNNFFVLGVSTMLLGLAMSGGRIVWQLWVTKLAPGDQVSAYMGVHSALTGLRGVAAPFVGYALFIAAGPEAVAWSACVLIAVSTAMFIPLHGALEQRRGRLG